MRGEMLSSGRIRSSEMRYVMRSASESSNGLDALLIGMASLGKGLNVLRHQGLSAFTWKVLRYTPIWYSVWNIVTSRAPVGTNI
jgi:hypothetical protein